MLRFDELNEGDQLPTLVRGPITREEIAGYSRAAGDPNPMHVDEEFAKAAGYPGIFAQGMLSMGYLGQYVVGLAGVGNVKLLQSRFVKITWPDEIITCRAKVTWKEVDAAGAKLVHVELTTENQQGEVKLAGRAVLLAT
jgi:acyl dehydratase